MSSEDSDDEPLSNLVTAKRLHPEKFQNIFASDDNDDNDDDDDDDTYEPVKRKKRKRLPLKKLSVTIKLNRNSKNATPTVIQRPKDVWLYLKDLNPAGPYCCLLCNEWFINRSKLIVHYILNHRKDFCGICRYFVPDREAWQAHTKFHIPWPCSQCIDNFQTETALRQHLSSEHKLVHCRLCHFRLPDDDQYNTHLFKKHNVTNVCSKDEECPWELEYEGSTKFLCLLCSKSNNLTSAFFNHYMGFHHFTLKCFSSIISGRDPPFTVGGANVSADFVGGLKDSSKFGYIDLDRKALGQGNQESDHSVHSESNDILDALIPEIKQESVSDNEDKTSEKPLRRKRMVKSSFSSFYKGDEDFDVTLIELIVIEKCYYDYINKVITDINSNLIPENSDINYDNVQSDVSTKIDCPLCKSKYETLQAFIGHMCKMHCLKIMPVYSCRVCATPFDSEAELSSHITKELSDFDDLWICQFCDKEFDNRISTRRHLTEHIDTIELDNCFSPHLGFKCKFCPTLFWNETDREVHQIRVHMNKHKGQFYKCDECLDTFSDKIWFIHHYMEKHAENVKIPDYMLKCCICSLVLQNMDEMRNHFNSEHPEARKIYCSLDACQFKPLCHRKSFQFHLRSVHNPETRKEYPTTCNVCGRDFSTARACGTHMAQVHGPGKFKCKLCSACMHTSDERKLHYLILHPGRHPFSCTECGKSFQYKSSLYMHKQDHSPNKQSFTCSYCNKVFAKKDSYREHVQIHEGPRHACSYCPMRFVQRSNMLRHERRHTGERPYACPQCPRTFADKGACTSHLRTHSKTTSYACIYCGQTFVQKSKLTYHIRRHTGENLETCTVCSKLFTSACSLREHMKTHMNKSKDAIKCPLCEKKFQDERYMLRHLRTSHTRSIFTCPICRKTLTSAAGLRGHVLTHSTVNAFACKCCTKTFAVKKTLIRHLRKRHNLYGNEINISDFYRKLDPRDCQLGLDEEVMTSIFGPPKKVMTDILIGDFVTFTKHMALAQTKPPQQTNNDEDDDVNNSSEDEDDGDQNEEKESDKEAKVKAKQEEKSRYEGGSECSEELEPTDFVSVKIEPIDDEMDVNVA